MLENNHNNQPEFYILKQIRYQRNLLATIGAILLLSVLLLSIKILTVKSHVVVVPSLNPENEMVYDEKNISEEYYIQFSLDVLHLMLDINPDNVASSYKRLQFHFLPESRQDLTNVLRDIKKDVVEKKLTTFFTPNADSILINQSNGEVLISGVLKTLTYNTITSEQPKTYKINYQFFRGRLYINSILEIENETKDK